MVYDSDLKGSGIERVVSVKKNETNSVGSVEHDKILLLVAKCTCFCVFLTVTPVPPCFQFYLYL